MNYNILICPVCKGALSGDEKRAKCEKSHSFDLSRQGYLNLLLSSKGGTHGDNKEMNEARRAFLSKNYYAPLCEALCEKANMYIKTNSTLIDCGCGECYYTDAIERSLKNAKKDVVFYGFDISRDAILFGTKRSKSLSLIVSGVYDMPFCDEGADALFCIFSPFAQKEFLRVLKKDGLLFMVIPKEKHLWSLKRAIYDTPYENEIGEYNIDGFSLVEKKEIINKITVSGEDLQNLFKMTPYYYRTKEKDKEKIKNLQILEVETEFEILIYKKN